MNDKIKFMKKIFLPFLLLATACSVHSQSVRLNFYSAYVFDDSFNGYSDANNYYNGKLNAGYQIGGGIEFQRDPHYGFELMYLHKSSDAPSSFKVGTLTAEKTETFDVEQHYILAGFNSYMKNENQKIEGYGGFMLGMVISDVSSPSTGKSGSNDNFAWGGRLGVNIWASHKLGLKLQAQLLSATRAGGGDVYYGYWGPYTVPDYTTIWQFGLGGGITYRIK